MAKSVAVTHSIIVPALVAAVVSAGMTVGGLSLSDKMSALNGQVTTTSSTSGKQGNWVVEKALIDKKKADLKKKIDQLTANIAKFETNLASMSAQGTDQTIIDGLQGRIDKQKTTLETLQSRYDALSSKTKTKTQ